MEALTEVNFSHADYGFGEALGAQQNFSDFGELLEHFATPATTDLHTATDNN